MSDAESQLYRCEQISVTSGGSKDILFDGDWVHINTASTDAQISFDGGPKRPCWARSLFRRRFKKITFYANDGTIYLNYAAGKGEPPAYQEQRSLVTQFASFADVSCGAGALTNFFSGSYNIHRVWISIPDGSANGLRIGSGAETANRGLYLPVGKPISIIGPGSLYAFNPGGSAVPITVSTEKF